MAPNLQGMVLEQPLRLRLSFNQTLQLIEYLLKNGSENCIENVRDHVFEIKSLTNYQFLDEKGKDQGINGSLLV